MKHTLYDRLLRREIGATSRYTSIKGLYGDRAWIDDLDIVNELGGHSGCVNALSWSSSGSFLASGSDDLHLNIYKYQPESSVSQFVLDTTVSTGHTENIFSVKFMPHSNDQTLVTCAGDGEVRVFDIEHTGYFTSSSRRKNTTATGRDSNFKSVYKGVRYMSVEDTNARIYSSHGDRVKRIVTESSPNLFLTCSEDGEVRQFDLRLPSSAYPPPKAGRGLFAHRMYHEDSSLPPPLISYKRYRLDLNTISCSASQPHYIALGGAHLHCFLHDRRMAGRDLLAERGIPGNVSPANSISPNDNELMGQATRCVRKFAPNGQKRMQRTDNGHITACKISDANPNEMIVSWSGDHIYSFDLIRSSDAADVAPKEILSRSGASRKMESTDRKRKRIKQNSSTSVDHARPNSKPRQISNSGNENGDLSIRIRYENGQSEDIAMGDHLPTISPPPAEEARDLVLSESQKRGLQIAKSVVSIRKLIFSLDAHTRTLPEATHYDYTSHSTIFTSVLGLASACLSMMDEMISNWKYPLDPLPEDVVLQRTLRSNRDSSRRFIQAAGTLARLLGGKLQTCDRIQDHLLQMFQQIAPSPYKDPLFSQTQIFSYEFLKAISLWLDGGAEALLQGFKRPKNQRLDSPRFPVPNEAEISGVDDYVIPYLLSLAQENSILNVDSSRFEKDESRKVFETETAAVIAFSHAIRRPLKDLSTAVVAARDDSRESSLPKVQDKKTAINFWAFKVGRGLLMAAGKGVNYQFVEIAFGGLGTDSIDEGRLQDDIDIDETDDVVESISLMKEPAYKSTGDSTAVDSLSQGNEKESEGLNGSNNSDGMSRDGTADVENLGSDAEVVLMEDLHNELADQMGDDYDEDDEDDDDDDGYRDDQDEEGDDDDHEITAEERRLLFQSASDRGKLRESVEKNVPCSSHSRQYKGHCNVKTVKDANFFGLEDEYVVSGSDSGHLFIWDKKTSQLVNILEGDNEVVNVVQGHPYEPILAVSGIDHTIKIFSPDSRAQQDASLGLNIGSLSNDSSGSISTRNRTSSRSAPRSTGQTDAEGLPSRKRMDQSYQIISQNDMERQGGMRDAFITRGMLAQLAARLQVRQNGAGNGEAGRNEEGLPIIIDDNCLVM